jgi:hypothetical protein
MTHTHTHSDTLSRTPLDEWLAHHTDLYLTTHNTHKTLSHASVWIRTQNPSKRETEDLRLRPRGLRDEINWCRVEHLQLVGHPPSYRGVVKTDCVIYSRTIHGFMCVEAVIPGACTARYASTDPSPVLIICELSIPADFHWQCSLPNRGILGLHTHTMESGLVSWHLPRRFRALALKKRIFFTC